MRQAKIFSGSSHPTLVQAICERIGSAPSQADLGKFANGETRVQINTSVRDQDVFIVQSGCQKINDAVMELLIMVSACTSGSARKITAVMPYFPYSRQSKKKSHRGSITARMLANLLHIAGVTHVITIDLHASQMQGFFQCPVDNLMAEPLLAYWIKHNIPEWERAVIVSKNPGGTKRTTSLADALKVRFGIVITDRRRPGKSGSGNDSMSTSIVLDRFDAKESPPGLTIKTSAESSPQKSPANGSSSPAIQQRRIANGNPSPLGRNMEIALSDLSFRRHRATSSLQEDPYEGSDGDEDKEDEEAEPAEPRDIIHGRLLHGHIIDDDAPSPTSPAASQPSDGNGDIPDNMLTSTMSLISNKTEKRGLGGSADAEDSSDEEDEHLKDPEKESTVALVGNVRGRPVVIVDDMIDKATSWIAAAETVVKRGGATKVYCMATHGLFAPDNLAEITACDAIDRVIVTNSLPLSPEMMRNPKLTVLDVAPLLAESIRRNKHGETMSQLFMHYD